MSKNKRMNISPIKTKGEVMDLFENRITVRKESGKPYNYVELEWHSDRNNKIARHSDVSSINPQKEEFLESVKKYQGDIIFPVVDIQVTANMYARAEFDSDTFAYSINSYIDPSIKMGSSTLIFPGDQIEPWENMVYVEPLSVRMTSFCLVKRVRVLPVAQCMITADFIPLTNDASGVVKCFGLEEDGTRTFLFETQTSEKPKLIKKRKTGELTKSELEQAIADSVGYLRRSIVHSPHSVFDEGIFCFYDIEARSYRLSPWMWQWGTAIHALLRAAGEGIFDKVESQGIIRDAWGIGNTSLKFQVYNNGHITHGLGTFRSDPRYFAPGTQQYITGGSDSNFLSGWGWIPLYRATGDKRFFEAATLLAQATKRSMSLFELLPQDYDVTASDWTNHTLDESGFGTEGLAELWVETKEEWVKELIRRYMDTHLAKLERSDGRWECRWLRAENKAVEVDCRTRGAAWAMEGLLSCARVMPEGPYVEKAKSMASHLLKWQHDDGHWNHRYTMPEDISGISEKGTAVWSILLSRLYDFTGDKAHLDSSRKALSWCLKNQEAGGDYLANGGMISWNYESGVTYRRWFPMICTYATAFLCTAACMEYERLKGTYTHWGTPGMER
jgi:hypothetical protein